MRPGQKEHEERREAEVKEARKGEGEVCRRGQRKRRTAQDSKREDKRRDETGQTRRDQLHTDASGLGTSGSWTTVALACPGSRNTRS